MKLKAKKVKSVIFSVVLLVFSFTIIFTASSCFAGTDSATTINDSLEEELEETGISDEIEEEIVEAVKGEDLTDYDNAQVGAEIKGAIPGFLCTNKDNIITIEVKNTSDFTWRVDSKYPVKVAYHYYGQDVDANDYDGTSRSVFENDVEPGETAKIDVLINDITQSGNYVLQIDIVLEGKYWFSSKGVEMLESPVFFSECAQ
ncbi:MAG: hypothetical protein PHU65_04485 [Actinomycetota bacterium]|nr:hypothetical protein [Actinomycetota bacterium]